MCVFTYCPCGSTETQHRLYYGAFCWHFALPSDSYELKRKTNRRLCVFYLHLTLIDTLVVCQIHTQTHCKQNQRCLPFWMKTMYARARSAKHRSEVGLPPKPNEWESHLSNLLFFCHLTKKKLRCKIYGNNGVNFFLDLDFFSPLNHHYYDNFKLNFFLLKIFWCQKWILFFGTKTFRLWKKNNSSNKLKIGFYIWNRGKIN